MTLRSQSAVVFGATLLVTGALSAGALPDSLRSFGPTEQELVRRALEHQGITPEELSFEKKWAVDSFFRIRAIDDMLDNPLHGPGYCDSSAYMAEQLQGNIPALLVFEAQQVDIAVSAAETVGLNQELDKQVRKGDTAEAAMSPGKSRDSPPQPSGISDNLIQSVRLILAGYEIGERYLAQGVKNLSYDEVQKLLMQAPVFWGDEDDSSEHYLKGELQRECDIKCDTSLKVDTDTMLPICRKLDRKAMALSGIVVGLAVNRAKQMLSAHEPVIAHEAQPVQAPGVSGDVYYYEDTKWGRVAIGGAGDNVYSGDFALVIDIGGDDRYTGRVGAGIGVQKPPTSNPQPPSFIHPFGVAIDLKGNDCYIAPKKLFNHGAGVFGAGFLLDMAGDDVYRGCHNAQGVGLWGTGVLLDAGGNDLYEAGWYGQGCGTFGFGLMLDEAGNDVYRIADWGQGFGSTWGYGLQADYAGNDIYCAGGKYIHHPLLPNDYRSFAQGFGMGFRPDCSGGIGLLYDKSGNDFYNAEVFCQGGSYWYSLGMLYDAAGNDHYNSTQYSQGSGIHLSTGILIDGAGDDQYVARFGPGQGMAHDLAVSILIDRKGNDNYSSNSGHGFGLTNSVGLFIDEAGHDNYMEADKSGLGTGNQARGFGGVGVFLDEDGDNDAYTQGQPGKDNSIWTQGTYGTGISLPARPKPETPAEETTFVPDTSKVKRPVQDVFKDAALWEVGEVRNKVKRARKELATMAREACEYIAREKLKTKDGLELRAIEELAKVMPDTIAPYLYRGLHDSYRWTRANCADVIGMAKPKGAIDSLLAAMKLPGFRPRWALLALGEIGDKKAVPSIIPYLKDASELTRISCAATLAKLKDARAVPELLAALDDKLFTVRSAAEQALIDIGDSSLVLMVAGAEPFRRESGQSPQGLVQSLILAGTDNSRSAIHYIRVLGILAGKADTASRRAERIRARHILIACLDLERPALRGVAVEALGRLNDETAAAILKQKVNDESDKYVLGKYQQALKR